MIIGTLNTYSDPLSFWFGLKSHFHLTLNEPLVFCQWKSCMNITQDRVKSDEYIKY